MGETEIKLNIHFTSASVHMFVSSVIKKPASDMELDPEKTQIHCEVRSDAGYLIKNLNERL